MYGNDMLGRIAFGAAIVGLIVINASLTAVFGYTYLGGAFWEPPIGPVISGAYLVLLFDVMFLAWYRIHTHVAETQVQRTVSMIGAGISLAGSTMATLQQLAFNTLLVDLGSLEGIISLTSLFVMLAVTAFHIVCGSIFYKWSVANTEVQMTIDEHADQVGQDEKLRRKVAVKTRRLREEALDGALKLLEVKFEENKRYLVNEMAREELRHLMRVMGFTSSDLDVEGHGSVVPASSALSHGPVGVNGSGPGYGPVPVTDERIPAEDVYLEFRQGMIQVFVEGPDGPILEPLPLHGDVNEAWLSIAEMDVAWGSKEPSFAEFARMYKSHQARAAEVNGNLF